MAEHAPGARSRGDRGTPLASSVGMDLSRQLRERAARRLAQAELELRAAQAELQRCDDNEVRERYRRAIEEHQLAEAQADWLLAATPLA